MGNSFGNRRESVRNELGITWETGGINGDLLGIRGESVGIFLENHFGNHREFVWDSWGMHRVASAASERAQRASERSD